MFPSNHPYHLRPDGAFEIDRYRQEAVALRREAMRCGRKVPVAVRLLVVAAVLMIVGATVSPPTSDINATSVKIATGDDTTERPREHRPDF